MATASSSSGVLEVCGAPKNTAVHLTADNYAMHRHLQVQQWRAQHFRITMQVRGPPAFSDSTRWRFILSDLSGEWQYSRVSALSAPIVGTVLHERDNVFVIGA